MKILITNNFLDSRTGTETFVRDLVLKLHSMGHYPMVYSPRIGKIAGEIASEGIPVVSNMEKLPDRPDVIHGHHHIPTVLAFLNFPDTPGVFVCHERLSKDEIPPLLRLIRYYIAVDYNCLERLTDQNIPENKIKVIYNSVDTDRFLPRNTLPSRPKRALVFSNYASKITYLRPIAGICSKLNIELDIMGSASNKMSENPEDIIGKYDLVFAKARCAMEAMAVGTAVILCDFNGLGPMVTLDKIDLLRKWNFGMRCLGQEINEKNLLKQIEKYDPKKAESVSRYIREKASLDAMAGEYLDLYGSIVLKKASKRSEVSGEFRKYYELLLLEKENYDTIFAGNRFMGFKWSLKNYLRMFLVLLNEPKKTVINIFRVYDSLRSRDFAVNSGSNKTIADDPLFLIWKKDIVKILRKISNTERMLHYYRHRKNKNCW